MERRRLLLIGGNNTQGFPGALLPHQRQPQGMMYGRTPGVHFGRPAQQVFRFRFHPPGTVEIRQVHIGGHICRVEPDCRVIRSNRLPDFILRRIQIAQIGLCFRALRAGQLCRDIFLQRLFQRFDGRELAATGRDQIIKDNSAITRLKFALDLARGSIDDDGVVEVVDQVTPLVEVAVFDREIVERCIDALICEGARVLEERRSVDLLCDLLADGETEP